MAQASGVSSNSSGIFGNNNENDNNNNDNNNNNNNKNAVSSNNNARNSNCMHGIVGKSMIEALKNAKWLPKYDDDSVRRVVHEIEELSKQITTTLEAAHFQINDPAIGCAVVVHHSALERNRRMLLAYHKHRMDKIENLRWLKGGAIPNENKSKMSQLEIEHFKNYSQLLTQHMKNMGLTITNHLYPPKQFKKEILILDNNLGEIITDDGVTHHFLDKNTRVFMPYKNVEMLIQNNKVKCVGDAI